MNFDLAQSEKNCLSKVVSWIDLSPKGEYVLDAKKQHCIGFHRNIYLYCLDDVDNDPMIQWKCNQWKYYGFGNDVKGQWIVYCVDFFLVIKREKKTVLSSNQS